MCCIQLVLRFFLRMCTAKKYKIIFADAAYFVVVSILSMMASFYIFMQQATLFLHIIYNKLSVALYYIALIQKRVKYRKCLYSLVDFSDWESYLG